MHDEFLALHQATVSRLRGLADSWAEGLLSPTSWAEAMDAVLLDAHTQAVVIGRTHAGDVSPLEEDDRRFAASVVEEQHPWLLQFQQDLSSRYTGSDGVRDGERAAARAERWAASLTGTANEAWGLTLDPDTRLVWLLGGSEETACTDCPELADASPYTPADLPTVPGGLKTLCGVNCRCSLQTDAGQLAFTIPG